MQNQKTNQLSRNKILLGAIVLVVVAALLLGIYFIFRPQGTAGEKTITVDVVLLDKSSSQTIIVTDEEYLRGALEQVDMIEGEEGEYGLFVTTVNGVTADAGAEQWWCFTKGGQSLSTGVDNTPIADGDAFEITLTEGY